MVSIGLYALGLVAAAVAVAGQIKGEDRMAAPMALFFYYGYLNEWITHTGWTTIGGRACRDQPSPCTFDQFMDATTQPGGKGGYAGGVSITDAIWSFPVKRSVDDVRGRGLNRAISWDPRELIIDAPSDKSVWEDHVRYVLNAFREDRRLVGHQQNYHNKAIDALTLMAEINAEAVSEGFKQFWRDNGVMQDHPEAWSEIEMPTELGGEGGETRTVIDIINLGKVWAYDLFKLNHGRPDMIQMPFPPRVINWLDAQRREVQLGYHWSRFRQDVHACRYGLPYPGTEMPVMNQVPTNWS